MTTQDTTTPLATNAELDKLYDEWMAAETQETAAAVLHGAYGSIETLAMYEQAVERAEGTKEVYEAAVAAREAAAAAPRATLSA